MRASSGYDAVTTGTKPGHSERKNNTFAEATPETIKPATWLVLLMFGGVADGARTHDNWNHKPGLYQLSYSHHWKPLVWPARRYSNSKPPARKAQHLVRNHLIFKQTGARARRHCTNFYSLRRTFSTRPPHTPTEQDRVHLKDESAIVLAGRTRALLFVGIAIFLRQVMGDAESVPSFEQGRGGRSARDQCRR